MGERCRPGEQRDRDRRSRDDRLWSHEGPLPQHPELARELGVFAERVREPAEAGDRRRRGRQQDQRPGEADEHLKRITDPARYLRADLGSDPDERRA